jgi:hypothetical protein
MKTLILIVVLLFITIEYSFPQTISYTGQIKPLFDSYNCTGCHGGNGGLYVSPYANLFTTGNHKPVVVAGDTNSVLIKKIKGSAGFGSQMPQGGPTMVVSDLNTIILWIKNGAPENSTSVDNLTELRTVHTFNLRQNYPNPFNPTTTISFSLPSKSFVALKVFDVLGREVVTIISEELLAGSYTRHWNASNIASGIYYYRLQAGSFIETKKLVLLR